ncbi:MAG: glycosyltransferase family 9 protein [Chloroflexota bacterium]|nr:MAG: glycosyltransferase family 9 protein [Chloroflexota bacterium]
MNRILVVKPGDLGDVLLATPALRALREAHPMAKIDLCGDAIAPVALRGTGLIDAHVTLPRTSTSRHGSRRLTLARDVVTLMAHLAGARYDTVVVLRHLTTRAGALKYAAIVLATGARVRAGLDNGRGWFLNARIRDRGFGFHHEAGYWLRTVSLLGADDRPRPTELDRSPDADARAREILADLPRPVVALHPGGGSYAAARRWPAERFAAVGHTLARDGASLVIVGNEAEVNGRIAREIGARNLTGSTSLPALAGVLERIDLLITNDSGVAHVGAAVRAPILAIYGQTESRAWAPYNPRVSDAGRIRTIERDLACRPCLYRRHELGWRNGCATRACLMGIATETVTDAARLHLARFSSIVSD